MTAIDKYPYVPSTKWISRKWHENESSSLTSRRRQPVTYYLLSLSATQQNSYLSDNLVKLPGRGNSLDISSLMQNALGLARRYMPRKPDIGKCFKIYFYAIWSFRIGCAIAALVIRCARVHSFQANRTAAPEELVSAIYRVVTPLPRPCSCGDLSTGPGPLHHGHRIVSEPSRLCIF